MIVLFIASLSLLAYRWRLLTGRGGMAAFIVGGTIASVYEWRGLLLLFVFFVTSNGLERLIRAEKEEVEKSGARDEWQVLANGGLGTVIAFVDLFVADSLFLLFAISLAASTADTWATIWGRTARQRPFHLRLRHTVTEGTSGAVTWAGTIGSLAGAIVIALCAPQSFIPIACGGFLGSVIDSLLGAYGQRANRCLVCGNVTEQQNHCSKKTSFERGIKWLNNDAVNFLANVSAVFFGYLVCL